MSIKESLGKAAALFGDSHEPKCVAMTEESKQKIIGDNFDITKHEFSDVAKDCHILFNNPSWVGSDLQIEIPDVNGSHADAVLIKEHAIAIAKHFKLTADDLK